MRRMLATFFSEAQYMDAFVSHLKNNVSVFFEVSYNKYLYLWVTSENKHVKINNVLAVLHLRYN